MANCSLSVIPNISDKMRTLTQNVGLYTDFYELTMAEGYFLSGKHEEYATFDYFFRANPYQGGYVVFAGISDFVVLLQNFRYEAEDLEYLESVGLKKAFLNYLKNFRFRGKVYSATEGEVVFPHEPVVRIEANLIEAQLIETLLLNYLNFQSLIATKAYRIRSVIGDRLFADFGLRRAQGLGGIHASKAAIIGGANATSNVYAGLQYNIPVAGTQAHSWIQSFPDELIAFREFAKFNPDNCILLVDTYNTLKSGLPNTITVAQEMRARGEKLKGIRLDSGDLADLSISARKMLDEAGFPEIKIFASNQLNEYRLKSLNEQGACIDAFGIGTELVTGAHDSALDGVYKLAECNGIPRMKLSETIEKTTLPGTKTIYRYFDKEGRLFCDGIHLINESGEKGSELFQPFNRNKRTNVKDLQRVCLHHQVYDDGEILFPLPNAQESFRYLKSRMDKLPDCIKQFDDPLKYCVGISDQLYSLQEALKKKYQVPR